jgi:hypothetical protein
MDDRIPPKDRIALLREENEHLRRAAQSFGELAERLMRQLEAERRRVARMDASRRMSRQSRHQPVA